MKDSVNDILGMRQQVTLRNLYLVHNIGAGGAKAFLTGMGTNPNALCQPSLDKVDSRLVRSNSGLYAGKTFAQAAAIIDKRLAAQPVETLAG